MNYVHNTYANNIDTYLRIHSHTHIRTHNAHTLTGVSTFAEQTETMEVHVPQVCVRRTAVLDYFQSPEQKQLHKIFTWENAFPVRPNR